MSGRTIRPATPDDRTALRAIQLAALPEPAPDLLALGIEGPLLVLVAETDRPVGYALAATEQSADTGNPADSDSVGYLAELAVAPPEQEQGHGSALLSATVDRLRERGCDRLRVTARADDEAARSFYIERGFTVTEQLPDYFESSDGVALVRRFGNDE